MKRFMYILISIAVLSLASIVVFSQSKFGKIPSGKRLERIKTSPNYKDGSFQNQNNTPTLTEGSFKIMTGMLFSKKVRITPVDEIPSVKTDLRNSDQDIMVWFGHSSYFMQIDGKKILVDPIFSNHASPFSWSIKAFKGSCQYSADDMPDIDYLFITHDHWDHLDYETILKMKPRIKKVICGLGVGAHLENWGFNPDSILELDWYEHATLDIGFVANATPAHHFSGRGLKRNKTLWVSFVLQTPSMKIFIGGDGGYDKHFAEIGKMYGPIDLAILEQGQYDNRWKYIHMLPDEVLKAAKELNAKRLIPVHNSKFALGAHQWDEPLKKLIENNIETMLLLTPKIGEQVNLKDTSQTFSHWWEGIQ